MLHNGLADLYFVFHKESEEEGSSLKLNFSSVNVVGQTDAGPSK